MEASTLISGTMLKFSKKKQSRKARKVKGRYGKFTAMSESVRKAAYSDRCAVCGVVYGAIYWNSVDGTFYMRPKSNIHHIFARRMIHKLNMNPHIADNLISCCGVCHGKVRPVEDKLFKADFLGFARGLVAFGWPLDRILAASDAYNLGLRKFFPEAQ